MRDDSWGVIAEDDKLSSAKNALEWMMSELSSKEKAIIFSDYIANHHELIGAVHSPSDIRDIIFIRLYKNGEDPLVGEKADQLAEDLISSSWWKHNLVDFNQENKLYSIIDNYIENPSLYLDTDEHAF